MVEGESGTARTTGGYASRVLHLSPEGIDWLAAWEGGYRLAAYRCPAGVWTISAGITRFPDGVRVRPGDRLANEATARDLFAVTIDRYESDVDALTRDDLAQHEFDALVSFAYNLGPSALAASTLLRLVNGRALGDAIAQQFSRWIYAEGIPLPGLVRRRVAEAACFERGEYRRP